MHATELERLLRHLESVRDHQPVATIVDGRGTTLSGDLVSFGPQHALVADPVSRATRQVDLPGATSVRVIAIGYPAVTFGDGPGDDETVVP